MSKIPIFYYDNMKSQTQLKYKIIIHNENNNYNGFFYTMHPLCIIITFDTISENFKFNTILEKEFYIGKFNFQSNDEIKIKSFIFISSENSKNNENFDNYISICNYKLLNNELMYHPFYKNIEKLYIINFKNDTENIWCFNNLFPKEKDIFISNEYTNETIKLETGISCFKNLSDSINTIKIRYNNLWSYNDLTNIELNTLLPTINDKLYMNTFNKSDKFIWKNNFLFNHRKTVKFHSLTKRDAIFLDENNNELLVPLHEFISKYLIKMVNGILLVSIKYIISCSHGSYFIKSQIIEDNKCNNDVLSDDENSTVIWSGTHKN